MLRLPTRPPSNQEDAMRQDVTRQDAATPAALTVEHWGMSVSWVTVTRLDGPAVGALGDHLAGTPTGATVVIDLADLDDTAADAAALTTLRDEIDRAVHRVVHVVVVCTDLRLRLALVTASIDHLAPMPATRHDARAFLRGALLVAPSSRAS
jgi:hypothetical protein